MARRCAAPPEKAKFRERAIGPGGLASPRPEPKLSCVRDDDLDPNAPPTRGPDSPSALNSADPVRNFSLTVDERIRALTIGVPAWAARKRRIEDEEAHHVGELLELHDRLDAQRCATAELDAALFAAARAIDLAPLNDRVRAHNRYYPVEANLPMDRKTGAYLVYGRPWLPEEPYSAERLVALARTALARRAADNEPER